MWHSEARSTGECVSKEYIPNPITGEWVVVIQKRGYMPGRVVQRRRWNHVATVVVRTSFMRSQGVGIRLA